MKCNMSHESEPNGVVRRVSMNLCTNKGEKFTSLTPILKQTSPGVPITHWVYWDLESERPKTRMQ